MKSLGHGLFLSVAAMALVAPACQSVSVPEWPYVLESADAGTPDGSSSSDGVSADGSSSDGASDNTAGDNGQSPSSMVPLACDGALCDTTNYTACNIANSPSESGAAGLISVLFAVAGMALARSRRRRQRERAS